jgi:hypothetical protein
MDIILLKYNFLVTYLLSACCLLSVNMSTCQRVNMSACQHINMSACQHVNMSTCQHVSMSACQHVNMSACQHVNMSTCQHVLHLSQCTRYTSDHGLPHHFKDPGVFVNGLSGIKISMVKLLFIFDWR